MPEPSPPRVLYRARRIVQFHETDAAGIIHFTAFLTYMEEAEHALLRSRGLSVLVETPEGRLSWPRRAVSCEFERPVKFEDEIEVAVSIQRRGRTSLTYGFDFTHQGAPIAKGRMTSVCCRMTDGAAPIAVPIPQAFLDRLEAEG